MAAGYHMDIAKTLTNFSLAVWYKITIPTRIIIIRTQEVLADFDLVVVKTDCQTAKFFTTCVQQISFFFFFLVD